jgi:hypothetical protein
LLVCSLLRICVVWSAWNHLVLVMYETMWYVCLDLYGTLLLVYMYAWTWMCMYVVGVFVWMTCHVVMHEFEFYL